MESTLNLAIIIGSVRKGRFGSTVATWFADQARQHGGYTVDVIDLLGLNFPDDMSTSPDVEDFATRIDTADAVVIVTPEYNHSFPGPLKTAIDSIKQPWKGKPVGFVAYGGMSGGLRAVEALRVVLAEIHATTVRDTVSFHAASSRFNEAGEPIDAEGTAAAATVLLDSLEWWGHALRTARNAVPYGTKASHVTA